MGIKISVDWLIDHDACHEGIARFAEQCGIMYEDKDSGLSDYNKEFDILSLVDGSNDNGDLLWLAVELVGHGMLEFSRIVDFINAAGKLALPNIREFIPPTKYGHLEKAFDGGVIYDDYLDVLNYAKQRSAEHSNCIGGDVMKFYYVRLVWALVRSLELKDLWLGGDEFEKAGFPQAEFNRLMTELLGHAKSK